MSDFDLGDGIVVSISLYDLSRLGVSLLVTEDNKIGSWSLDPQLGFGSDHEALVYSLGIDTKNPNCVIQLSEESEYRCLDGSVQTTRRVYGRERRDKAWLQGGHASEEVKIAASRMKDMGYVLHQLANGNSGGY